jgi:hypothetical protein
VVGKEATVMARKKHKKRTFRKRFKSGDRVEGQVLPQAALVAACLERSYDLPVDALRNAGKIMEGLLDVDLDVCFEGRDYFLRQWMFASLRKLPTPPPPKKVRLANSIGCVQHAAMFNDGSIEVGEHLVTAATLARLAKQSLAAIEATAAAAAKKKKGKK